MRRAVLSSVAVAGAALGAVPTLAAPADAGRAGVVSVTTALPGGETLTLDVTAAQLSSGDRLVVDATRCDASDQCSSRPFSGALGAGDLTLDPSAAAGRLTTTLDGRPLVITWQAPSDGYYAQGGEIDGGPSGEWVNNFAGQDAAATVQWNGHECETTGGVGTATVVDAPGTGGGSAAQPLSGLDLPADAALRC